MSASSVSKALSLKNVWVEYGDKIVLERINLDIEDGAFVSVVGPSGAGKSSLLKLVQVRRPRRAARSPSMESP